VQRRTAVVVAVATLGIVSALLAFVFPGRPFEAGVMAAFGIAGIITALNGFVSGVQVALAPPMRHARYRGGAARWGSAPIAILGAGMLAAAIIWFLHAEDAALRFIGRRPGVVLVPIGTSTLCEGIARSIGWYGHYRPDATFHRSRIGGAASAALGIILLCLGLLEAVAPDTFDQVIDVAWRRGLARLMGRKSVP